MEDRSTKKLILSLLLKFGLFCILLLLAVALWQVNVRAKLWDKGISIISGVGLTGGGNVKPGESTTVDVVYGSTHSSAAQGDITLTCPSGAGNVEGIGNTITIGAGGTCNTLTGTSGLGDSIDLASEVTNTLPVSHGGTGVTNFTAFGILYGNGAGPIRSTTAAANSVLVTNGSSMPSLSQTLPTAVQGNITSTGALTSGSIALGFGTISTANNISTTAALTVSTASASDDQINLAVTAGGAGQFVGTITNNDFTATRTFALPNKSGTFCMQGSSSCGFAAGGGSAFLQDGNSFGATATLGTNDAFNLAFEANGTTRMTIDTSGNVGIGLTPTGAAPLEVLTSVNSIQRVDISNTNAGASARAGLIARADTAFGSIDA